MALLETADLTITFGGLRANDSVRIVIEPGSFVGTLSGPPVMRWSYVQVVLAASVSLKRYSPNRRASTRVSLKAGLVSRLPSRPLLNCDSG